MLEKDNYFIVDLLKLFFSICVVCLHTYLFLDINPDLYWYLSHIIWRLAVPYFFITSGYFFCKKIRNSSKPNSLLLKSIKRLGILLIFWLIVNLPFQINNLINQGLSWNNIIITLVKNVIFYPWGALWYILALIVGYILIFPFLKKNNYTIPLILGSFLYLFALLSNSYYFLIEGTWFRSIVDKYMELFISSRNGLFVGFFYLAIANYLTIRKDTTVFKNIIFIILGLILLGFETYLIKNNHYVEDHSLFVSLLIVVPNLFELSKKIIINKSSKTIRNLSIGIYVLHRPILALLEMFFVVNNSILKFIIVLLLSLFISYILQRADNKYINKVIT